MRTIMSKHSILKAAKVLLAAGSLGLIPLWATDVQLTGDTYVTPGSASNFGALPNIVVGPSGAFGLVQFDLTSIPAGSNVTKAYLQIFVNKVNTAGSLALAQVSSTWSESTVNGSP